MNEENSITPVLLTREQIIERQNAKKIIPSTKPEVVTDPLDNLEKYIDKGTKLIDSIDKLVSKPTVRYFLEKKLGMKLNEEKNYDKAAQVAQNLDEKIRKGMK